MKTADDYAEAAYDLVSIRGKDVWHMPEVRALVAEIQADARRAALEDALDAIRVLEWDENLSQHPRAAYTMAIDDACLKLKSALLAATPAACSCTITRHERQENRACPVHFPHHPGAPMSYAVCGLCGYPWTGSHACSTGAFPVMPRKPEPVLVDTPRAPMTIKVDRLRALALDFADTYRLDKFQRDKLVEMLESAPALLREPVSETYKLSTATTSAVTRGDSFCVVCANGGPCAVHAHATSRGACGTCGGEGALLTYRSDKQIEADREPCPGCCSPPAPANQPEIPESSPAAAKDEPATCGGCLRGFTSDDLMCGLEIDGKEVDLCGSCIMGLAEERDAIRAQTRREMNEACAKVVDDSECDHDSCLHEMAESIRALLDDDTPAAPTLDEQERQTADTATMLGRTLTTKGRPSLKNSPRCRDGVSRQPADQRWLRVRSRR